jgi:hypothetical protein
MPLELIGPHPFARDEQGRQLTHIGTIFPRHSVLYTQAPAVHAWQRSNFIEHLNAQRAKRGEPPLSAEEEEAVNLDSVDLVFEPDHILIRPDPDRLELAFAADDLLQTLVSKRQVKFLSVSDSTIREAIKRRGECWRLSSLPKSREAKASLIFGSKVGICGPAIYFYNRLIGTRWLTYKEFKQLGALSDAELAAQLQEIADHLSRQNRLGRPELALFGADPAGLRAADFAGLAYAQLPADELRARYNTLVERFAAAVPEDLRTDDGNNRTWTERMLATLFLEGDEAQTEQILSGLSQEFFLQIEWLAGGRFEEGEFLPDPVFEEAADLPNDIALRRLCDPRAKEIIYNLIRDFGDIEYINVGTVPESLSLNRPQREVRRGVFLVELRARGETEPIKRFMRLQKWGVWEHLDANKDLLQAIQESDEYTDYWLDRRLGCRQLGMSLCNRVLMRRLNEIYQGTNRALCGQRIRTTYFEREYLPGMATDKLPRDRYTRAGYAERLATLLGQAAAPSLIVGRSLDLTRPAFDDGDEVVREGADGLPSGILVGDHSGSFTEYELPLATFAVQYARPVNRRAALVPDFAAFTESYLAGFREHFLHIQGDYRKRRRAFDNLFKHCRYDPAGSFAYRWECVLRRLEATDVEDLVRKIREHIGRD